MVSTLKMFKLVIKIPCHYQPGFFLTGAMATPTKLQNPTILGLGVPAVPNGHTLAGFAIGTLILRQWLPQFKSTTQN